MQKSYTRYSDFDKDYGFAEKAGFQLSPFQQEDVEQFVQWEASLNAYEVGSGKTVVSTVVSLMRGVDITLVVMPPILIASWTNWLKKVSDKVVRYDGTPVERKKANLADARWVVMSHAIFRIDFDRLVEACNGRPVEVIVDEAHFLKNSRSVLFKKTQTMSQGHYCQMLTGTPTSKPLDCYSYIKIKSPKLYRSYTHFEALHVGERDFWKTPISFINLDLLRDNFALRSISRTKKEVHGYSLVPLFPDTSYDLAPEHKLVYDRLVEEQLLLFSDGSKIDATTPAKLRHALQQAVINFDHFSNNADNRSAFYDILDQTIEETECDQLGKSKLIIWTKYKMTSAKLWEYCKKRGIKTVAAYSESNASEAAEAFMHDETTRILVANPQSAGAGLNPQHVCSEALFAEIDTVPIYARQAIGRIDRTGQKVPPRIKIAVARGTVQEWLFHDLMRNDDQVARIEPTKDGLRRMLMGQY